MSRTLFATSHAVFAISPVSVPAAVALFFSLFNPLKKKKKESGEGKESARSACHQSQAFCHQSRTLPVF